jgi:cell wall-associated NlpC family hydrolase
VSERANIIQAVPGALAGLVLALLALAPVAGAYHTNFQAYCNNEYYDTSGVTRSQARGYAETAVHEGYQWGGGCWNDDDVDQSPGDPPQDPNTNGEGPDCSGFVYKSWYERNDTSLSAFRYHFRMQNVHGPYVAESFLYGVGAPNTTVAKANAIFMDAFASSYHVGMVYQAHTAYNTDRIIEAKCEACGTGIWSRTYRGNPDYGGARRVGWAG